MKSGYETRRSVSPLIDTKNKTSSIANIASTSEASEIKSQTTIQEQLQQLKEKEEQLLQQLQAEQQQLQNEDLQNEDSSKGRKSDDTSYWWPFNV